MDESRDNNRFRVLKVSKVEDLINPDHTLPESDLTIQTADHIIQYELEEEESEKEKFKIKPGCWSMENTMRGMVLNHFELRKHVLLESITNTSCIISEANKFFSRLNVYAELKREPRRGLLLYSVPGCGKCLHPDQEIIMFDGSFKKAKEVIVGDKLMGPDSKPRNVLSITSGVDDMYRITPVKGDSYTVNKEHVLSLRGSHNGSVVNIAVKDWLKQEAVFKKEYKGYRAERIEFNSNQELPIPPYILGLWLGDGSSSKPELTSMDNEIVDIWKDYGKTLGLHTNKYSREGDKASTYAFTTRLQHGGKSKNPFINLLRSLNLFKNKHVPTIYKIASVVDRLEFLAGFLDTDGHYYGNCFEITQKNKNMADDIMFISRSLGFAAYVTEKTINGTIYYRIVISGEVGDIPTKLPRKRGHARKQVKKVTNTGIKEVTHLGLGKYNGFTLDSDHLFLLKDFTVTHNSASINKVCEKFLEDKNTAVIIWDTASLRNSDVSKFFTNGSCYANSVHRLILIIEDIGGGTVDDYHGPSQSDSALLNLLDGVGKPFQGVPTFIIATTNNPNNTVSALIDRPGRFDKVIQLKTPSKKECIELLKFILEKDSLSENEIEAAELAAKNEFSIAHLQECIVRSKIDDIEILEATKQLVEHKKKYKQAFQDAATKMGLLN